LHREADGEKDHMKIAVAQDAAMYQTQLDAEEGHDASKARSLAAKVMSVEDEAEEELGRPVLLIQETAKTKRYPFTITQDQARKRLKRLHQAQQQRHQDHVRERAHTPPLQDIYRAPGVAARLATELTTFDHKNEEHHPALKKAKEAKNKLVEKRALQAEQGFERRMGEVSNTQTFSRQERSSGGLKPSGNELAAAFQKERMAPRQRPRTHEWGDNYESDPSGPGSDDAGIFMLQDDANYG